MRLKSKVAMITGGGSGLGRASCLVFAKEGAKVAVADIDPVGGKQTVAMIEDLGGKAAYVQVDTSKESSVRDAVAQTVSQYKTLDILFNNAGIANQVGVPIEEVTEKDWDALMAVNIKGILFGAKYAVPVMKQAGGGAIVNTASIAGMVAMGTHAYAVSKGGVIQFTRNLAFELAPHHIRVNAIAPGFMDTPLMRGERRGRSKEEAQQRIDELSKAAPLGRIGHPEDIAFAALYLASDEASFVTGHTLVVDGGFTIR